MSDDATKPDWTTVPPANTTSSEARDEERTSFCQDCGTAVKQSTAKTVGSAVFCEPCLAARVAATSSTYAAAPGVPPQSAVLNEPSPALAAILGFIPGVGAMYNGQFAKGILHLIIFAVFLSLANDVNDIFGLFVAGWLFYMAFEAYHTAVARRDGLPLPNPFGFNDISERLGFGKGFNHSGATGGAAGTQPMGAQSAASATTPPPPTANPGYATGYAPVQPPSSAGPAGATRDWVGYVRPSAFASAASPNYAADLTAQVQAQAMRDAGYQVPYAETYTGAAAGGYPSASASAVPGSAASRFPVGAIWLIALGVVILLANLLPDWNLTERWWPPVLFAAFALWAFLRRLGTGARVVCIVRWPITLMVIAILLALRAAYVTVTFGLTLSVLLIVFGLLLLLERTAGGGSRYVPTGYVPPVAAGPAAEDERGRTVWAADAASMGAAEQASEPMPEPRPEDRSRGEF